MFFSDVRLLRCETNNSECDAAQQRSALETVKMTRTLSLHRSVRGL